MNSNVKEEVKPINDEIELSEEVEFDDNELDEVIESDIDLDKD